jgi:hypothetical protein
MEDKDKFIRTAKWYKDTHNLSIIPCKDKRPTVKSWKEYQTHIMSDDEIDQSFANADQIAIIAGIVSGGLEIIDFDIKHLAPLDQKIFWDSFIHDVQNTNNDLFKKLQINSTRSGGYHVLYRCEEIEGNKKLAKKLINNKYECIIETRGEGGYVIAPPSEGYTCIENNFKLSVLDTNEREMLLNLCKSYNEEPVINIEQKRGSTINPHLSTFKTSPFEDYNLNGDVITFLTTRGWKAVQEHNDKIFLRRPGSENFQSANFHKQKRILYMFSSGDAHLEPGKGYNPSQVFTLIECRGDYKESFKKLRADNYGTAWNDDEREVITEVRQNSGSDVKTLKQRLTSKHPSWLETDIDKIIETALQLDNDEFWFVNDKGILIINNLAYNKFLHNVLGYALWDSDITDQEKPLIKITKDKHQVELVSTGDVIKRDVEKWLIANVESDGKVSPNSILSCLLQKDSKLFNRAFYEWLPAIKIDTFNDTVEFSYFFFRNGIVKVSAEEVVLIPYQDVPENMYIWKDRIRCNDFDIDLLGDEDIYLSDKYSYTYIDKETKKKVSGSGSAWYKYIRRISGLGPEFDTTIIDDLPKAQQDRMVSTMTIIGYLLHSYKDDSRPWAVIINEDTPTDGKGGGSGKQIFTKGLSVLRNLKEEDGRQLNTKERFAFQGISEEHDVFVMDDVPKWFKLDTMYRMFTNDMVVEIRNVGRKTIPFKKSPKFVFSTNYDITGTEEANHLKRRIKQLLFECYYGPDNMPINEIGMLLDAGWEKKDEQWTLFFNFMFLCVLMYLNKSVMEIDQTEKTKEKKIRNQFGDEFFEFMQDMLNSEDKWRFDWWVTKPVWLDFKEKYEVKTTLSSFKTSIKKYFALFLINYNEDKEFVGYCSKENQEYKKQHAFKVEN